MTEEEREEKLEKINDVINKAGQDIINKLKEMGIKAEFSSLEDSIYFDLDENETYFISLNLTQCES